MSSISSLMLKGVHKKVEKIVKAQMGSAVEVASNQSLAYQSPLLLNITFVDEDGVRQDREIVAIYDRHDPDKVKLYSDYAIPEAIANGAIKASGIGHPSDIYADMMKLKQELVLLKNGIRR